MLSKICSHEAGMAGVLGESIWIVISDSVNSE